MKQLAVLILLKRPWVSREETPYLQLLKAMGNHSQEPPLAQCPQYDLGQSDFSDIVSDYLSQYQRDSLDSYFFQQDG